MCRLAAYLGPELGLSRLLLEPQYGLMEQSWAPREMKEGRLNADGYGFGWFATDGKPAAYTNPSPIWTDPNLPHLGRTLSASQWLANVRSATRCTDISHFNTQPFHDDRHLFLHNGYVADFAISLRNRVRCALSPEIESGIHGNTDSEYLFGLFRQIMANHVGFTPEQALLRLIDQLGQWLGQAKALLNVIIGDGKTLYACRHAFNGECPSLYYTVDDPLFPGGQLLASEPLTTSDRWLPVPEHHVAILDGAHPPRLIPL